MCMQDIVISQKVEWRRLGNAVEISVNVWRIPPSQRRFALAVLEPGTSNAGPVRLGPAGDYPAVNVVYSPTTGETYQSPIVTIVQFPGVFGQELYFLGSRTPNSLWEAVMLPELDTLVQELSGNMETRRPPRER